MILKEGQIWRKQGPYDWIKIERILMPGYPDYDGGLPGIVVRHFPPQLKGIQLRGGKTGFYADTSSMTAEEQITMNRYLLPDGWKKGDNANNL